MDSALSFDDFKPGFLVLKWNDLSHGHTPVFDDEGPAFPDNPQVLAEFGFEFCDTDSHSVLPDARTHLYARTHLKMNMVLHDPMIVTHGHFIKIEALA